MNTSPAPINCFPVSDISEISSIQLGELHIVAGPLLDVIEPDGEEFVLALVGTHLVEVPSGLSAEGLWTLVGKCVWIAKINGQILVGEQT